MNPNMTTKELLVQRKLTRTIGEIISDRMKEYVTTLTPLFRQRAVLGDNIQGSGKEPAKNADQAFKELQRLYQTVATAAPFHLPKDLNPPLLPMTSTLELSPWEYVHTIKTERGPRGIAVTCPFKAVVSYAGYSPGRLKELLNDRNRAEGELQQFVLHYLAMRVVTSNHPGLARMLDALHFPIGSGQLTGLGALPVTYIASAVTTRLPPDELVIESTELSGKDAFEELVDTADIEALRDPLRERLSTAVRDAALT
jgi:hypothetical protein